MTLVIYSSKSIHMDRKTSEPKREPITFGSKSYPDRATRTRVNEWIGSVAKCRAQFMTGERRDIW